MSLALSTHPGGLGRVARVLIAAAMALVVLSALALAALALVMSRVDLPPDHAGCTTSTECTGAQTRVIRGHSGNRVSHVTAP